MSHKLHFRDEACRRASVQRIQGLAALEKRNRPESEVLAMLRSLMARDTHRRLRSALPRLY
jgi:hypothetical protein